MKYIEITQDDIDDGRKTFLSCDTCGMGRALARVGLFWRGLIVELGYVVTDHRYGGIEPDHRAWKQDAALNAFHISISSGRARPGYIVLDDATMTASYVERLPLQPDWSAIVRRAQEDVAAEAREVYQGVEV